MSSEVKATVGSDDVEAESAASQRGNAQRSSARNLMSPDLALPGLVVALFVFTALLAPSFLQVSNLQNILRQMAVLLVLACAAALVLISGGIDLSIGAVAGAAGVVAALAMNQFGILVGILTGIIFGVAVGVVNGLIIAGFDVSPFIVTLGMLSVAEGFSLIVTGGLPVYGLPSEFTDPLGYERIVGIPISFLIAFVVLLLFGFVLNWTKFGKYMYAMGGNFVAAVYAGIAVKKYQVLTYAASGLLAAIAGLLLTGRVAAAQPTAGIGLELQAIAAVIIGGVALTGGSGRARHALFGVALLTLLSNSMNLLSVPSNAQLMVIGGVVIVAVVADRIRRK